MPAKPLVTAKAKREAIIQAYGGHRIEDDADSFYYARRHLAKLDQADEHGWHELRYQDEEAELVDAIEKALQIILERDGKKYFKEAAGNLIDAIASNLSYHVGSKALRRELDRDVIRRAMG